MRIGILSPGIWAVALPLSCAALPQPHAWAPARLPWPEIKSLELLADSPINCLLLESHNREFVAAAAQRGLVTLALISAGEGSVAATRKALAASAGGS
jgi:hypothetical protein